MVGPNLSGDIMEESGLVFDSEFARNVRNAAREPARNGARLRAGTLSFAPELPLVGKPPPPKKKKKKKTTTTSRARPERRGLVGPPLHSHSVAHGQAHQAGS